MNAGSLRRKGGKMPERTIMWNEITDQDTLKNFMERMSFFHDSCIKELKYLAGAIDARSCQTSICFVWQLLLYGIIRF